ncbi:MAG: PAS domain S-box protein, partial [Sulfurifustis sp.]
ALDNFEREAKRRRAEVATQRYARMYAALGTANEALLRAKSPDELYQRVCAAAVDSGGFVVGGVVLANPGSPWATLVAATGPGERRLREVRVSFDESYPEGQGLIGIAFRSQKPCVSNDYMGDERSRPWRGAASAAGVGSTAALPLVREGRSVGAMVFYAREKDAFDEEIVKLLERMMENVSFALDNFEREAERRRAGEAQQRATRMYAALSATNEAILHARSPDELYRQVCEAIVQGGSFLTAIVFTVAPGSDFATVAAAASKTDTALLREIEWSIDPSRPEAQSLSAIAFATQQPCISNDYLNDPRTRYWHSQCQRGGVHAAASLPIVRAGRSVGVLVIYSRERNAFDDETVNLMRHISKNVASALDNFEHEAERARAAEALRASEEKYRHVLETMYEGYFEVDLAGNYTFFNDALCRIQGYSREEMMGMNYRQYTDPETAKRVYAIYNEIYRTGASTQLTEWAFVRKDGTRGIWESSPQVIRDAEGKPIGFRGVVRDVTLRRETEERLRASEEKYRTILENMTEGYFECDLAGNFTFFNEAERKLVGYDRDELMGLNYRSYMDAETADKVRRIYHQIYRTGVAAELEEYNMIRKDGGTTTIQASVQLIRDAAGKPIGFRGVTRDVTRRQRAELALRASEEKHRTILESMYDSYFEVDLAGNYTFFNNALCRLHGRSREELTGLNYRAYMDEATAARVYAAHNRIYRTGQATELMDFAITRKDGSKAVCEATVQLKTEADGKPTGFRGVVRDVTLRRREQKLFQLEHTVTRHLAGSENMTSVLTAVLRDICQSEEWESARYYRVEDRAGTARLIVGWHKPGASAKPPPVHQNAVGKVIPDELFAQLIRDAEPIWIPDLSADSRVRGPQPFPNTGEHAGFIFPIVAQGKVIGVMMFSCGTVRAPDERLRQTMRVIGNQVGQFLQRQEAEEVLRESEARFRALTELSSDWYWEQDAEFRFTRMEGRQTQHDTVREHYLGKRIWELGFEIESGTNELRTLIETHRPFRDIVIRRVSANSTHYLSVSGEPIYAADGQFAGYRGVSREVTDEKLAEQRIQYLATHDALTDLPNRVMFSELLSVAIASAKRYERKLAVLFIDLDRFKIINDTLGHDAGDVLLKEMSVRLRECLRASDVVARLGGDEFVVLLPEVAETGQVAMVARKILTALMKPISIFGQECRVTASIGICLYPSDGTDEQSLMKNADSAMYLAKEEGKNNFQFYSHNIKTQSLERLTLEANLRRALERNEFTLHYQAKLDFRTGKISGVEALLRWHTPELGFISPAQFIPLAEEAGLIVPIGRWVLKTACCQSVAWQRQGLPPVRMAVNLSARQFGDSELLNDIRDALSESGLNPALLELELTEGMVMQNAERAAKLLAAIKEMGVHLAIDDFGTGYSSL